jgi:hypothetical protein
MAEKRQFELLLLRMVPHLLRDDFMTVGVVLVEANGEFADVRFTRDWKRVECFAPEVEVEILEQLEAEVRARLKEIRGREQLLQFLEEKFGSVFDVGPVKAMVAQDPVAEMGVLERDYLAPMRPVERARRMGRMGIVGRMEDRLADAGVLDLVMRDLDMTEFTGKDDAFRVDFGYRVGRSLKMLQALALSAGRDPAVALAHRFLRIQDGLRARGDEVLMTAVVSEAVMRARGEVASGVGILRASAITVRGVEEMGEIAVEVKRELAA